jgi:hypothetical protein
MAQQVGRGLAAAGGIGGEPDFADPEGRAGVLERDDQVDRGGQQVDQGPVIPTRALRRTLDEGEEALEGSALPNSPPSAM